MDLEEKTSVFFCHLLKDITNIELALIQLSQETKYCTLGFLQVFIVELSVAEIC